MKDSTRTYGLFGLVVVLILATGFLQSWNSALLILNMGLISAIMALGVNLQSVSYTHLTLPTNREV